MVIMKGEHTTTSLLKWDLFVRKHPLSHIFSISGFRAGSKAHVNEVDASLSSTFNV